MLNKIAVEHLLSILQILVRTQVWKWVDGYFFNRFTLAFIRFQLFWSSIYI